MKLKDVLKWILQGAAVGSLLFILGAFMVLKAPQYHANYLRDKVGSQVVMVHANNKQPVGTGFLVKSKKYGKVVISNAHVCRHSGAVTVISKLKQHEVVNKLKVDTTVDLCMLEAPSKILKDEEGLNVELDVKQGEEVGVFGHPGVLPLTFSRGQLIGEGPLQVAVPITYEDDVEKCEASKGRLFFFPFFMCLSEYQAYYTTVPGIGGNSGSPLVNFWGDVVGVIFAGNGANWLSAIPSRDLNRFIND